MQFVFFQWLLVEIVSHILILILSTFCLLYVQQNFGKITLLLGRLELFFSSGTWAIAKPNQAVVEGDVVLTHARSRCEITLRGGGKVK